jgi:bacillithiol synthase
MNRSLLPFPKIPQLSERDVAYATQDERLRPFYKYPPTVEGLGAALEDKQKDNTPRSSLTAVLQKQYKDWEMSSRTRQHLQALSQSQTFTVATAHQPSLFTGPLYYIYKIISTIKLAERLQQAYPDYHFVPIFITGGEDHDFEEVNHLHLFGKTISWHNEESGAVGQMSTESLEPVLEEVVEVLGDSPRAQELSEMLRAAVEQHSHYADTARHLTRLLFDQYGLVILDPSHPRLKATFTPYIKEEIFQQPSKRLVNETVAELEKAGFSEQAYPRDINFFYLGDGFRARIVEEGGKYQVLDQGISWSREELEQEIERAPERFSPNVVMRPIYQEHILPNLAYVGGGGELAYWLERKAQFEHFGLNYPVLIRRNSVLFVDKGTAKRLDKVGKKASDFFEDVEQLIKEYVKEHTQNEISLKEEKEALTSLFKQVETKAGEVDPTLVKAAAAEGARQLNSLEQLEGKLMRAEKQRHDTAINQMRKLKEKLFPDNGLQERYDNFMMYYLKYGEDFFYHLMEALDPLEEGFVILEDR